jgi:hypothetical protein
MKSYVDQFLAPAPAAVGANSDFDEFGHAPPSK